VIAVTLGVLAGAYFVVAGVSARPEPSGLETFIARTVRDVAIGWHAGHPPNPVPNTEEGADHFIFRTSDLSRPRGGSRRLSVDIHHSQ
jgi:hypothetical protein